jgi:hypothetical protein
MPFTFKGLALSNATMLSPMPSTSGVHNQLLLFIMLSIQLVLVLLSTQWSILTVVCLQGLHLMKDILQQQLLLLCIGDMMSSCRLLCQAN